MNCEDFNEIIPELADYKPMSAAIREASVSHAALCPECATKLADARAIGGYLLEAARAESEQAPARIKENLLTAFAASQQQQAARANVVDIGSRRKTQSWLAVAAAIAAVLLLAVVASVWRNVPSQQPSELQAGVPGPLVTPPVSDLKSGSSPVQKSPEDELGPSANTTTKTPRKSKRVTPASRAPQQSYETVAHNSGGYLALTYLAEGTAMDSGTVVRVELSRSALASLGFSASSEGSAETVRAEVILGDDGVARAIRLIE